MSYPVSSKKAEVLASSGTRQRKLKDSTLGVEGPRLGCLLSRLTSAPREHSLPPHPSGPQPEMNRTQVALLPTC